MASGHVHRRGSSQGVTLLGSVPPSTTTAPDDDARVLDVLGTVGHPPDHRRAVDSEVAPAGFDAAIDAARARMSGQQLAEGEG